MKKKQLEMFLQKTPSFPKPKSSLEQYQTPATIAAEVLFIAYQYHDIEGKTVLDLGCGTGVFSFGASLLGAKKVIGIDKDLGSIKLAEKFAKIHHLPITFHVEDVSESSFSADTVIMNPPFGAQKANSHADQLFLKKAIDCASVVYSLHLSKTISHLERFLQSFDASVELVLEVSFPLKAQFRFHTKLIENVSVSCLRIKSSSVENEKATK